MVSKSLESRIRTSCQLPEQFKPYKIDHADTVFTEGPFGYFFSQEIMGEDWLIGWLRFCIKKHTYLYPTTQTPMIALYCPVFGNIRCVLEGYGELVLREKEYGLCYVPPGIPNKADFKKGTYDVIYFSFTGNFLAEFIEQNPRFKELYCRQQESALKGDALPVFYLGAQEMEVINRIEESKLSWPMRKMFIQARVMDLLVLYFLSMEKADTVVTPVAHVPEDKLLHIVTYIEQNFYQPITIPFLCRQVGMSLSSFERSFKMKYKVSPNNYIKSYRLQQAAILLEETDLPVQEISCQVGITSVNYFSDAFKKRFGCPPTQYRKLQQPGAGEE